MPSPSPPQFPSPMPLSSLLPHVCIKISLRYTTNNKMHVTVLFQISKLETFQYLTTSTIGLLPSQILNSYMGSTVRSLEDVVNHQGVEGYLVFALQILISVGMMLYFVRRARHELNNTIKAHDANKQEGMLENGKDRDDVGRTNVASDMDLV
uniref:Transmembrane protein 64 n=1 Tax=Callorhinchus milii TaxID=7868 RepID=A0A4W3JEN9_CALMI